MTNDDLKQAIERVMVMVADMDGMNATREERRRVEALMLLIDAAEMVMTVRRAVLP